MRDHRQRCKTVRHGNSPTNIGTFGRNIRTIVLMFGEHHSDGSLPFRGRHVAMMFMLLEAMFPRRRIATMCQRLREAYGRLWNSAQGKPEHQESRVRQSCPTVASSGGRQPRLRGRKTEACPRGETVWFRGSSDTASTIRTEILEARPQHIPGGCTERTNGRYWPGVRAWRCEMGNKVNPMPCRPNLKQRSRPASDGGEFSGQRAGSRSGIPDTSRSYRSTETKKNAE